MPRLTISVLALNRVALTKRCVDSILAHTRDFELRILDNGSTDETPTYLRELAQQHPEVVFATRVEKNIGFIAGHNLQAKAAQGRYVCILNNDVEVGPRWDELLIAPFEQDPWLGATGPLDDYGGLDEGSVGVPIRDGRPPEYISGHCLMVPRLVIERHGLFDGEFLTWATCEDADFSLRIRKAGYAIKTVPAPITHVKRATMDHTPVELLGFDPRENEPRNHRRMQERWGQYLRTRTMAAARILIQRGAAYGDVLCVEPVIRALKQCYPHSEVGVLTNCPEVLKGMPILDGLTSNHGVLGAERFDRVIDLHLAYERKPHTHLVQAYLDVALPGQRISLEQRRPRWYLDQPGNRTAASMPTDRPICVVASEGSWPIRQWPKERFQELASRLTRWFRVVEVGNRGASLGVGWDLCGRTTLQQLAGVYSRAALAVMCDSFHVHLAACFSVPTIGIWGGTDPRLRVHGPEHVTVIREGFDCLYCHHDRPAPSCHSVCDGGKFRGLSVPAHACMDIPVAAVWEAIIHRMETRSYGN